MDTNGWRAPEYDHVELIREAEQQFAVTLGGAIDPAAFYLDSYAASDWWKLSQQSQYLSNYNLPAEWTDKIANIILHHLGKTAFDQNKIDVIGLGVGDGEKETSLCGGLLRARAFDRLRCFLLDISPTLATKAHAHFTRTLARPNVEAHWLLGSIMNLPRYKSLFHLPEDANILRVGTMFMILDNVRHEKNFIQQSLRAFKSKDILVVDACLGFAPTDQPELIKKEDPSLNSVYGLEWIEGVIRRYRPQTKKIKFDFQLKMGESTFPKSYTIEILATVDDVATFSIFQKHRYNGDEFIKTFDELGWRPLDGMLYGFNQSQMIYVFAKK